MIKILLIKRGDDTGVQVQHAKNKKQAESLIGILPKTLPNYYYKITN